MGDGVEVRVLGPIAVSIEGRPVDLGEVHSPVAHDDHQGLPAGDRYAVTGGVGAVLWDLETLTPIGDPFPHVTDYRDPAVAADAKLLGTTTEDGAVIWDIDVERWPELACRLVGRNLTEFEWQEFGPQDQPYRATCDQWPALG